MSEDNTKTDLLVPLTPADEAGEQVAIRKDADGNVRLGTIGPVRDGQPIPEDSEVIDITHLEGPLYEVRGGTRPALVNSKAYKSGWDNIFGLARKPPGDMVN